MKFKNKILIFLFLLCVSNINAQIINAYAKVSNISGTTISLINVDEAHDSFEDGEQIIIMQMQDDIIGSNTGNNSNFGLLSDIKSTGLYEIVTISSHTELMGVANSITIISALNNTFHIGSNTSVQLISFPQKGTPNYTSGNLSAKAWDGNTGGVLAFQITGKLTIGGNIDCNNKGFRGASANGGGSTSCSGNSHYRTTHQNNYADKGEGIYKSTTNNQKAGRARILSGGGGGNSHNAGGGGGSNYSAGGLGGPGWPNCSPTAGGMGGLDLSSNISASRIFMGGGGGAGEGNNGGSRTAGNGGGLILIKANEINTSGTCGPYTISANGQSITSGSGNDGNSGGGAGGSIVIETDTWNISSNCQITVEANGGNGGDVTHGASHGAGGGGGQGVVVYSTAVPSNNISTTTNNGSGGRNCNTCGYADNGSGTDGDGVQGGDSGPLPISLIYFSAEVSDNNLVDINWATAMELNNNYFTIERSVDGLEYERIEEINGAGNSNSTITYHTYDDKPLKGDSFYRLKQTDYNGDYTYSKSIHIFIDKQSEFSFEVFPNPISKNDNLFISVNVDKNEEILVVVYDLLGNLLYSKVIFENISENTVIAIDPHKRLPVGTYIIIGTSNDKVYKKKLIIKD